MNSSMNNVLLLLFICILCFQNINGLGVLSTSYKTRQYNINYNKMMREYMDKCNNTLYPVPIIIPSKKINCEDILQFNINYLDYKNQLKIKQINLVGNVFSPMLIFIIMGIVIIPFRRP
jgi:hypothetical protein